jgi:signal peptidase I
MVVSPRTRVGLAIVAAALLVLPEMIGEAVTTYYVQVARVEGSAMAPTLFDQDRLVVSKRAYRMGEPAIGDIVMLRYPLDPRKTFVMRVIAIGGDEVRVVVGTLYRNGEAADEPFIDSDSRGHDDWGPGVVPTGFFFVMGTDATTAPIAGTGVPCPANT